MMKVGLFSRISLAAGLFLLAGATRAATAPPPADPRVDAVLHAGLPIEHLHVADVAGILIVRGDTTSPKAVTALNELAASLGYTRVANLVRLRELPNDDALARIAERRLAATRALDGCQLTVEATAGVLNIAGTVRYDGQKQLARDVVRNIDGVRGVVADLRRQ